MHERGVSDSIPNSYVDSVEFFHMVGKSAESGTCVDLGGGSFTKLLTSMIRERDISNRTQFIGGLRDQEPPSESLHDVDFSDPAHGPVGTIAVRIRLFACLGTPTYIVAVGRQDASSPAPRKSTSTQER